MKALIIGLLVATCATPQDLVRRKAIVASSPTHGSYFYRRTITVDHTKVPNTDQTSQPVLFRSGVGTVNCSGSSVTLATGDNFPTWMDAIDIGNTTYPFTYASATTGTATGLSSCGAGTAYSSTPFLKTSGGTIQHTVSQTGGATITVPADFVVTSDSGCATPLPFEFEDYSSTNGKTAIWYNQTLSHTVDTLAYLCYSAPSISTYQGSVNATWNSAYHGVWHLQNLTTSTLADSTSNANTLTKRAANNPAVTSTSEIPPGQAFVAANSDYARNASTSNLHGTVHTIEIWFKATATPGTSQDLIHFGDQAGGPFLDWALGINTSNKVQYSIGSTSTSCTTTSNVISASAITAGNWYYVMANWNGTIMRLYINGVADNTTNDSGTSCTTNSQLDLGLSHQFTTEAFGGTLDEPRNSNVARSADYATATYNNLSSPLTFYSLGPQL